MKKFLTTSLLVFGITVNMFAGSDGNEEIGVTISPNPAASSAIVNFDPSYGFLNNEKIIILNPEGKVVMSRNLTGKIQGQIFIDISELDSGSYFVLIGEDKKEFIIER
jgi:hypothetical protein